MKRDSYLRDLSSDHHLALALARDIIKGCGADTPAEQMISRVRGVFRDELDPHFVVEEQTILPALQRLGESALADKTLEDHERLRQLVAQLEAPGALLEFAEALKAHVRFEERTLFQACQHTFDEAVIASLEGKTHQQGRAVRA